MTSHITPKSMVRMEQEHLTLCFSCLQEYLYILYINLRKLQSKLKNCVNQIVFHMDATGVVCELTFNSPNFGLHETKMFIQ